MDYYVTWNERVFYASSFTTDAEIYSDEWYQEMWERMEQIDSNGMDDLHTEVEY